MAGGVKRWWKKVFEFKPDANKFWVRAGAKVPGSPDEQHAYRYPAPGYVLFSRKYFLCRFEQPIKKMGKKKKKKNSPLSNTF